MITNLLKTCDRLNVGCESIVCDTNSPGRTHAHGGDYRRFMCFVLILAVQVQCLTSQVHTLTDALYEMESHSAAPVMPDGKVGGNGSCALQTPPTGCRTQIIVSKTGKLAGRMTVPDDLCIMDNFDNESWSGDFYSVSENVCPMSDAPLHFMMLNLRQKFEWPRYPKAALHGHALETTEKAAVANIPCSEEETLFSTPADTEALVDLIEQFPYPENNVYIRKNHGFFILGETVSDMLKIFNDRVVPHSLQG